MRLAGSHVPDDDDALAAKAEERYREHTDAYAVGTPQRGGFLLDLMAAFWPTPSLQEAYFENLAPLLARRPLLPRPGRVVLGLGPGRCGSTSLTQLVSTLPNSCATHENPPLMNWQPATAQIAFHLRRMEIFRQRHDVVFDAAHWWLNAVPAVMARFPGAGLIGLCRDVDASVRSILRVKGAGPGSLNHWAHPGAGPWAHNRWDATYPKYPVSVPPGASPVPFKRALIARYVSEYHQALEALAARWPGQVLLVRTGMLSDPETQERIYGFIGVGRGRLGEVHLNRDGSVAEGAEFYRA